MARSTVNVLRVLEIANGYLACDGLTAETKQGVYQVLQRVLHETGNYAGLMYLFLRDDHRPCITNCTGRYIGDNPGWTKDDENSRVYLHSRQLKKQADKAAAKA
jgi:hypothetical protein